MSIRIAANISFLFAEVPMAERFGLAGLYGFDAVEIQFPYDHNAIELKSLAERANVDVALINMPAGDLLDGGEGLAAVSNRQEEFDRALQEAIEFATTLGVQCVNVVPGRCLQTGRESEYLETYKRNLASAADLLAANNIVCVFEAINTNDMPGFLIHSPWQQMEIIAELQHPNLFAQVDVYHIARDAGLENVIESLRQMLPVTRHIQFADAPRRGEPGTGDIDFEPVLNAIRDSGYHGFVAAEYKPTQSTPMTLDWLPEFRRFLTTE